MSVPQLQAEHVLLGTLVIAARTLKSKKKKSEFRLHNHALHQIIHDIRFVQKAQLELLEHFVFSDSGPVEFSPAIEESFEKLHLSGLLNRPDPQNPEILVVTPAGDAFFEDVIMGRLASSQDLSELRGYCPMVFGLLLLLAVSPYASGPLNLADLGGFFCTPDLSTLQSFGNGLQ